MNQTELRDFISQYFDDNELRDLCFDLGIDYEGLPAVGKSAKARELIAYCQRRESYKLLEKRVLELRPNTPSFQPKPALDSPNLISADKGKLPHPLRIFLCHSSADKPTVRDLYRRLVADGFDVWFDEESLIGGQEWRKAIPKAIRNSDAVLVCLSRKAINKSGYVQKEIGFALDVAEEKPEDTNFVIPVRFEECDSPQRLQNRQWVSLFEANGYNKLIFPRFSGGQVKPQSWLVRSRGDFDNPAPNDGASHYRTLRCTKRCPAGQRPAWHTLCVRSIQL